MIRPQLQDNPRRLEPAVELPWYHDDFLNCRSYRRRFQLRLRQLWRLGCRVRVNPVCQPDDACCRDVCLTCTIVWLGQSLRADGEDIELVLSPELVAQLLAGEAW